MSILNEIRSTDLNFLVELIMEILFENINEISSSRYKRKNKSEIH